jgi:molecular chaperone GrpE
MEITEKSKNKEDNKEIDKKNNKEINKEDSHNIGYGTTGHQNRQTDEQKKEEQDYKDKYLRLLAEFDNYKKFKLKQNETVKYTLTKELIADLISVMEDFEYAFKHSKDKKDKKGFELIYKKLCTALNKNGLKQIKVQKGDVFQCDIHDAILQKQSDLDEGKIIEVVKKGYMLNNVIIKHPKVIVSKGMQDNNTNEACQQKTK